MDQPAAIGICLDNPVDTMDLEGRTQVGMKTPRAPKPTLRQQVQTMNAVLSLRKESLLQTPLPVAAGADSQQVGKSERILLQQTLAITPLPLHSPRAPVVDRQSDEEDDPHLQMPIRKREVLVSSCL